MHSKHKLHTNQSGFGIIWILAVVVIIIGLGYIGFIVANKHTKTTPTSASAQTTDPSPAKVTNPTPAGSDAKQPNEQSTLTIKEWGLIIPLSAEIRDAYYVVSVSSSDNDGSPNTVWLGTKALDALGCKATNANTGDAPLGSISRSVTGDTDPVQGKPYEQLRPNGITIGNFYYSYGSWAKSNKCAPATSLQTLDSAFSAAIKNSYLTSATTNTN